MPEQNINNDPLKNLYTEFNPKLNLASTYDEFKNVMSDKNNRMNFFNEFNSKLNLAKSFEEFDSVLGLKKKGGINMFGYTPQVSSEKPSVLSPSQSQSGSKKTRHSEIAKSDAVKLSDNYQDTINGYIDNGGSPFSMGIDMFGKTSFEQSREGKTGKIINNFITKGALSSGDLKYLNEAAPVAAKQVVKTIDKSFDGKLDPSTIDGFVGKFQAQQKDQFVQSEASYFSNVLNTGVSSLKSLGFDDTKASNELYLKQFQSNVTSNKAKELSQLNNKYPLKMDNPIMGAPIYTSGNGTPVREKAAEYNKERALIEQKYNKLDDALGRYMAAGFAKKNPNADPLLVGLEYLKYADPIKYKTRVTANKRTASDRDISEIGTQVQLTTTTDINNLKNISTNRSLLDERFPEQKIAEVNHKLAAELYKSDNWFMNLKPSSEELEKAASQLTDADKIIYEKYIKNREARFIGTDIPQTGAVNKFAESIITSGNSTRNFMAGVVGARGEDDRSAEILNQPFETRYQNVGESPMAVSRLEQLNEKVKTTPLSAQEINEKFELEKYTNVVGSVEKFINNSTALAGQVAWQALLTKGVGGLATAGARSIGLLRAEQIAAGLTTEDIIANQALDFGVKESFLNSIAGSAIAYTSSYDDAVKQASQLGLSGAKAEVFASVVATANAATERIFKDEKILDAFKREIAPNISSIVAKLGTEQMTKEVFETGVRKIIKDGFSIIKATEIETVKETVEESATSAITSAAIAALAPDHFSVGAAMKDLTSTMTSMFIDGQLVGAIAGVKEFRANRLSIPLLNKIGSDVEFTNSINNAINVQFQNGLLTKEEADDKKKIVNEIGRVNKVVMPQVDQVQKLPVNARGKYAIALANEGLLKEKIKNTTDEALKSNYNDQVKVSEEMRKGILNQELIVDDKYNVRTVVEANADIKNRVDIPFEITTYVEGEHKAAYDLAVKTLVDDGMDETEAGVRVTQAVAKNLNTALPEMMAKAGMKSKVVSVMSSFGGYTNTDSNQYDVSPNIIVTLEEGATDDEVRQVMEAVNIAADQQSANALRNATEQEINDDGPDIHGLIAFERPAGMTDQEFSKMMIELHDIQDGKEQNEEGGNAFLTGHTEIDNIVGIGGQFYGKDFNDIVDKNLSNIKSILGKYNVDLQTVSIENKKILTYDRSRKERSNQREDSSVAGDNSRVQEEGSGIVQQAKDLYTDTLKKIANRESGKEERSNKLREEYNKRFNNNPVKNATGIVNIANKIFERFQKLVPQLKLEADNYAEKIKALKDAGTLSAAAYTKVINAKGFYDPKTSTIYLNQQRFTKDTPIHEFTHVWFGLIKDSNPSLFQAGMDMLTVERSEDGVYVTTKDGKRQLMSSEYNDLGDNEIKEEFLTDEIGLTASTEEIEKSIIRQWLEGVVDFIKNSFGVKNDFGSLTLDQFINLAARDVVSGGKTTGIKNNTSIDTSGDIRLSIDKRLTTEATEPSKEEKVTQSPTTPAAVQANMERLREWVKTSGEIFKDSKTFIDAISKVFKVGSRTVSAPSKLIKYVNDPAYLLSEIKKVTPQQRKLAEAGLNESLKVGELYRSGVMTPVDTAYYFLWSICSTGISPYPHEAGFLNAIKGEISKYIQLAVDGKFDGDALKDYLKWVREVNPTGQAGAQATANLNSFGNNFLSKGSLDIEFGEYKGKNKIQALHELISNYDLTTDEVRLKWFENFPKMAFNNKIFDFTLLVTGRVDTVVTDRVRTVDFWGAEDNIYDGKDYYSSPQENPFYVFKVDPKTKEEVVVKDGFASKKEAREFAATQKEYTVGINGQEGAGLAKFLTDLSGLAFNTAVNKALTPLVKDAYAKLGVTENATVGRFHWETWVANSQQEVSHGTLGAILQMKEKGQIKKSGIRQGKYGAWDFNFQYRFEDGIGFRYVFEDTEGNEYICTQAGYNKIGEEIKRQNTSKNITENERFLQQKSRQTGQGNTEDGEGGLTKGWYEYAGTDSEKYFDYIRSVAEQVRPASTQAEDQTIVDELKLSTNNDLRDFVKNALKTYSREEVSNLLQSQLGLYEYEALNAIDEYTMSKDGEGEERDRSMARNYEGLDQDTVDRINDEARTYFQKTNAQTQQGVEQFIEGKDSLEVADYVLSNPSIPDSSKVWMAATIAKKLGEEIKQAKEAGDDMLAKILASKRADIYNEFAKKATELGQAVQAFVAFKNDPSAIEFFYNKILKDLKARGVENLTKDQKDKIKELLTNMNEANEGMPKNEAIIKLGHYLSKITPTNPLDIMQAIWYAKILSGISTQIKNILANTINTVFELPQAMIRESFKNMSLEPFMYGAKGILSGVAKGAVNATDMLITGSKTKEQDKYFNDNILENFSWGDTKIGKTFGGAVGKIMDFPLFIGLSPTSLKYVGRALSAADQFFNTANQEAMSNMLAYATANKEGVKNKYSRVQEILNNNKQSISDAIDLATQDGYKKGSLKHKRRVIEILRSKRNPDITDAAQDFAQKVTLTGEPEGFTRGIYLAAANLQKTLPISKFSIPFTKIVANISEMMLNYSPAGFYRALSGIRDPRFSLSFKVKEDNKLTNDERADLFIKSAMAMAALSILISKSGDDDDDWFEITASGPFDSQKKYELMKGGWRPYTITFKNGYKVSYVDWPISAIISPIGTIHDAYKYESEEDESVMAKLGLAARGFSMSFYDKSLVKGISDFVDLLRPNGKYGPDAKGIERMEKFAAQQIKSVTISNFSQQVLKIYQDIKDKPIKEGKGWATLYRDLPIINDGLNPIIDVFGDEVKPAMKEKLFPWYSVSDKNKDEMIKYLTENGVYVGIPNKEEVYNLDDYTTREMTDDELYKYRKLAGQKTKEYLIENLELIKSIAEDQETPELRKKVLKAGIDGYKTAARKLALFEIFYE